MSKTVRNERTEDSARSRRSADAHRSAGRMVKIVREHLEENGYDEIIVK